MASIVVLFALGGAFAATFYPFLTANLAGRGFPPAAIGVVQALGAVSFLVVVPIWGHLADVRWGRARAMRIALVASSGFVLALVLPWPPVPVVVLVILGVASASSVGPLSDALAVNALDDPARNYGKVRAVTSASFAVVVILAGLLYARTGYGAAPVAYAAVALAFAWLAGRVPDRERAHLQGGRRGGALREAFRIQPRLPRVLLAIALAHVGVFAGLTFLSLRILELGGGPPQIAASSAVAATTEVAAMIVASRLARRVGLRALFAAATLLQASACLLWMAIASPEGIIASRVISGAAYSGMWISSVHTMRTLLPPSLQGTGQGLFGVTASGVAAVTANVIGGLVYGSMGPAALFGVVAVVGVGGAGVGWLTLPRRGEVVTGGPTALGPSNPDRTAAAVAGTHPVGDA